MTHRYDINFIRNAESLPYSITKSPTGEFNVDLVDADAIPAATTDREIALVLDVSQLTDFFMIASGDCTVELNTTTGTAIALLAGIPYFWIAGSGITCPLTVDVTKIFVTTPAGSAVDFRVRAGFDSTP